MQKRGDRIGEYVLEEQLGAGTFGAVWRARHHAWPDRMVAVKLPTDAAYVHALRREGLAVDRIEHPGVVRALAFDPYAEPPYLVLEYVPGQSLRQVLQRGPLRPDHAIAILEHLLRALTVAHAKTIVHRDIKPENVLIHERVKRDGLLSPGVVKLTDFGLVAMSGGESSGSIEFSTQRSAARARELVGTLAYMAPELQEGRPPDPSSDLYSCGVVLFESLTGKRPGLRELPSQLNHGVPVWLDLVYEKACARIEGRYQRAEEMLADLRAGRQESAESAHPRSATTTAPAADGGSVESTEVPAPEGAAGSVSPGRVTPSRWFMVGITFLCAAMVWRIDHGNGEVQSFSSASVFAGEISGVALALFLLARVLTWVAFALGVREVKATRRVYLMVVLILSGMLSCASLYGHLRDSEAVSSFAPQSQGGDADVRQLHEFLRKSTEDAQRDEQRFAEDLGRAGLASLLEPTGLCDADQIRSRRQKIDGIRGIVTSHFARARRRIEELPQRIASVTVSERSRDEFMLGYAESARQVAGFIDRIERCELEFVDEVEGVLVFMSTRSERAKFENGAVVFLSSQDAEEYNRRMARLEKLVATETQVRREFTEGYGRALQRLNLAAESNR